MLERVHKRIGEVLEYGESQGKDSITSRSADFHFGRMMAHLGQYLKGDEDDDHLGHFITRAMIWVDKQMDENDGWQ
jgi:hypothetical protein